MHRVSIVLTFMHSIDTCQFKQKLWVKNLRKLNIGINQSV